MDERRIRENSKIQAELMDGEESRAESEGSNRRRKEECKRMKREKKEKRVTEKW